MRHAGLCDPIEGLPRRTSAPPPLAARAAPWEAASWDQVWAEYDAGQARAAAGPNPATMAAAAPRRRRGRLALALVAALGCAGLGLLAAAPVQAAAQLATLLLRQEVAPLLAQLDHAAPRPPLSAPAAPALGGAADAYLAMLAGELQQGWRDEAALRHALAARRQAADGPGDATLRPVARWAGWEMTGWSSLRLLLAPEQGPQGAAPGLGLDLAWRGGAWRVTAVSLEGGAAQLARAAPAPGRSG